MNQGNKIFLDYNATTPVLPVVKSVMFEAMDLPLNPSSTHSFGRTGKKYINAARNKILKNIGAEGATIIFTSSGTEANNMALRSIKNAGKVLITSICHDSVIKPASFLNNTFINVDKNGLVNLEQLKRECESLKQSKVKFVTSIIHSNNETGVIQNISDIAPIIYSNGGYLHIDASQSVGKVAFNFNSLNVDMATISAHKIGGPKGAAALVIKSGLEIQPLIYGGGQEGYLRAGTENLPAIVGFAEAVEYVTNNLNDYQVHTSALIEKLETGLKNISAEIQIFSKGANRLSNTSNFSLPECDNETSLINLDLKNIAISAGSACSSGRVVISHVLSAMGVNGKVAKTALRVSVGMETKMADIEVLLAEVKNILMKKALKNAV